MANVEHSTLTTTNLHENKGVSTATDNTVATAVTGATVWAKLTASNLTTTGNSFGAQLFHLQQTASSGTDGGSLNATTWTKRTVTSITNEITSASVASGVITLPAGTYFIDAVVQQYASGYGKSRFRNTTAGTTTLNGLTSNDSDGGLCSPSTLRGRFIIAGSTNFEIQSWTNPGNAGSGQGKAATSGETEVYVDACIWKVL